jgi:hypothetical protein
MEHPICQTTRSRPKLPSWTTSRTMSRLQPPHWANRRRWEQWDWEIEVAKPRCLRTTKHLAGRSRQLQNHSLQWPPENKYQIWRRNTPTGWKRWFGGINYPRRTTIDSIYMIEESLDFLEKEVAREVWLLKRRANILNFILQNNVHFEIF